MTNLDLIQEIILLKIDKHLDNDDSEHDDKHDDEDRSSQQAALSDTIPTNTNRLSLINGFIPLKWFSKVKIVFAMSMNSMLLPSLIQELI